MQWAILLQLIETFGCIGPSIRIATELCIVNPPGSGPLWYDALDKILTKMSCPQQVISSESSVSISRVCTLILVPLDRVNVNSTTKILSQVLRLKSVVRFSPVVFIGADDDRWFSIAAYRSLLQMFGLVKSVLIENVDGENVCQYNFMTDQLEYARGRNVTDLLEVDIVRNVQGYMLRSDFFVKHGTNTAKRRWLWESYYSQMVAFASHLNATMDWKWSSVRGKTINWYIRNRFDLVMKRPFIYDAYVLDVIPEHRYGGVCLLIPEKYIGPYILYLHRPFEPELWIAIVAMIVVGILNSYILKLSMRLERIVPQRWLGVMKQMILLTVALLEFLLCEAYLVKMVSFMLTVKQEPHFRSLDEFNRSSVPIYVLDHFPMYKNTRQFFSEDRFFFGPTNRTEIFPFDPMYSHPIPCDTAYEIITMAWNQDTETRMTKFYILNDPIHLDLRATSFLPKSPFFLKYQLVDSWLFEAGFWNYWVRESQENPSRSLQLDHDTLRFKDLISLWWILPIGDTVSGLIFLAECLTFCGFDILHSRKIKRWIQVCK